MYHGLLLTQSSSPDFTRSTGNITLNLITPRWVFFIFFQHSSQKAYRNLTSTCAQPWKIKHCFLTHTINNMSSYVLKGREISHWWNHHWYSLIYTYIKRTGDSDVKLLCNHLLCVFTFSTKGAQIRNYFDKQEGFTLFFFFLTWFLC